MVGLGKAALDKGYKRVMVIAEDYAFPYSQVQGFMTEYCRLGGKVPVKAWVPLGGKDYSSVIARIPKDVDALLVVLGGADAVNFLNQYEAAGGDKPMIGGSITVSQDVRTIAASGAIRWSARFRQAAPTLRRRRVEGFRRRLPEELSGGYPSPCLFALVYYNNMKAALDGLDAVKGDLSGSQKKYREALAKMTLKTPTGDSQARRQPPGDRHDVHHRGGEGREGRLYNKVVSKVDNVNQMLGIKNKGLQDGLARRAELPAKNGAGAAVAPLFLMTQGNVDARNSDCLIANHAGGMVSRSRTPDRCCADSYQASGADRQSFRQH